MSLARLVDGGFRATLVRTQNLLKTTQTVPDLRRMRGWDIMEIEFIFQNALQHLAIPDCRRAQELLV